MAFGTDAPDRTDSTRGPGSPRPCSRAIHVGRSGRRRSRRSEALTLDRALRAACVDAAISAGELRSRAVSSSAIGPMSSSCPSAALDEPVEPDGALSKARPNVVLMDGRVVFER